LFSILYQPAVLTREPGTGCKKFPLGREFVILDLLEWTVGFVGN
jgi:hypothetical protein